MVKQATANNISALRDPANSSVLLMELDVPSGMVRMNSSAHTFTYATFTWNGIGDLVSVSNVRETTSNEATGIQITINGIPSSMVSMALGDDVQGRPARILVAMLDQNFQIIDGAPIEEWKGRIDRMKILDEGKESRIEIACESKFAALLGTHVRRFTDRDHQQENPGDKFFQYLAQMKEVSLIFPGAEFFRR